MAWWRRKKPVLRPVKNDWDPEASLAEAGRAREQVRRQRREQQSIANTIREVRERNHLAELFGHDGMGA